MVLRIATEQKISKHFHVWSEAQLIEMSRRVPRTLRELMDISEVSENKAQSFGEDTLRTINDVINKPGFVSYLTFGEFEYLRADVKRTVTPPNPAQTEGAEREDVELVTSVKKTRLS